MMKRNLPVRRRKRSEQDKRDLIPAFGLSAAVHVLLFIGLFTVFQWSTDSETVYAELWAPEAVSGGNDPNGVAQKIDAPEPKPDEPDEPRPDQDAQEAAQKAAEEQAAAEQAAAQAAAQAEVQRQEEARLEAARQAEAERAQAEAKAAEEQRQAQEAAREKAAREAAEKAEAERAEKARQDAIEAERRAEEQKAKEEAERLAQEKLAREKKAAEEARKAEEARIAEEKRKAEEQKAEQERKAAAQKAEQERIAKEKQEAAEKAAAAKKAEAERKQRERIRQAVRQQELARLNAKVDPNSNRSGTPRGDKRNVRQNLTGSALASYSARVVACVRPWILYDVPPGTVKGQIVAKYNVSLLPNGERRGAPRQVKSSGVPAYDRAVERAIYKCQPFPKPDAGYEVPSQILLSFDPVEKD
jgi:colicin import membrane protein